MEADLITTVLTLEIAASVMTMAQIAVVAWVALEKKSSSRAREPRVSALDAARCTARRSDAP